MLQEKQMLERQAAEANWITKGTPVDIFKHHHRLAEIQLHKQAKKFSLLEEILKRGGNDYTGH